MTTRRFIENVLAAGVLIFFVAIAMFGAVVIGLDMPDIRVMPK